MSSAPASSSAEQSFIAWARRSAIKFEGPSSSDGDRTLATIGDLIADHRIVALSEAVHGGAEPLRFRNQLFRQLVENHGFTAIAIESGAVEAHLVHDYVRGSNVEIERVLIEGFGWTMGLLGPNRELIEWMRAHNARSGCAPINFYGFDIAGSPGNTAVAQEPRCAILAALAYLEKVAPEDAHVLGQLIEPFLELLQFYLSQAPGQSGYELLTPSARDELTGLIQDIVTLFERKQPDFESVTSPEQFSWSYRAAICARQVDSWFRQIPLGWEPLSAEFVDFPIDVRARFISVAHDVRDRAQADNISWVIGREPKDSKLFLFGHRYHLSSSRIDSGMWFGTSPGECTQTPAGVHLRRRFGDEMIIIGSLVASGEWACGDAGNQIAAADERSLDGIAREAGASEFFLDLRSAPDNVRDFLSRPLTLGSGNDLLTVDVAQAYDCLHFVERVTPAAACLANAGHAR